MELKPGYKQTEVGVIPKDWEVIHLGEIFSFKNGLNKEKEFFGTGTPIVNYMDVFQRPGLRVGDLEGRVTLSKAEIDRFDVRCGDVFFTRTSETVDEIGTAAVMLDSPNATVFSGFVLRARPLTDHLDDAFKQYCFADASVRAQIVSRATYTTRALTNGRLLSSVSIALPPKPEQRDIAAALSDVDALLDGLDRLIAKKRDIKQAAMQQLLTGDTRLPGFEGEWETVRASDVGQFRGGSGFPIRFQGAAAGEYPFFKVSDMNNDGNDTFMETANNYISESLRKQIGAIAFPANSIVFAKVGAAVFLERKKILKQPSCLDNNMAAYILDAMRANTRFIHYALLHKKLGALVSTTALPSLSGSVLSAMELALPPIEEQANIAAVLSDMDAEIEALEQRRAKTADVKQAMMQELLTGKTRLIEQQVTDEQAQAASGNAKGHNWAINEAVVIATLAKHFGNEDYPLGRKRYTKLAYLLHRRVEQQVEGYLKKAAGPYNPQTRYGGPEKIAKQNGYIKQHDGSKGHNGFIAAENVAQAESYFEKWYGPEVIQWLEQFRYKKNDDLEVLATVDMAAVELRASGKDVDVAAVKDVIASHPDWEAKLDRAMFSDANIAEAIKQCEALLGSEIAGGSLA